MKKLGCQKKIQKKLKKGEPEIFKSVNIGVKNFPKSIIFIGRINIFFLEIRFNKIIKIIFCIVIFEVIICHNIFVHFQHKIILN